ncbi:MAG: MFS transporter [Spongiibacter sp.]|nr:MFS transporter [Spongiibacter sp.]
MNQPSAMSAIELRAVTALASLYVFRMLGLFMLLPVLPLYAAEYDFSTPMLVGLALGVYGLGQAVLQIPLGMLSDRIGRKPVIISGLLLFAAGGLLAASAESIFMVIAGRLLQGCGAIASTLSATVADLTREHHRSKAMAAIGMSIGVAFGAAMVLGPWVAALFGVSGLFLLTSALALLGILTTIFMVPSVSFQVTNPGSQALAGLLRRCLSTPELMRLNIGVFVLHAVMMMVFIVVPLRLLELELLSQSHWKVYLPVMAAAFVLMVPFMVVAEKRGLQVVMLRIALVLMALAFTGAALVPTTLFAVVAVLLLFFTAFNYLEASLPSLLSRMVYAGGKGTAMGVFSSFQFLGAFCGGAVGGWLLGAWGEVAVFTVATAGVLLWLGCTSGMAPPEDNVSVTLAWRDEGWSIERLRAEVLRLPGTLDMTVFESERQAYLRVRKGFDISCLPAALSVRE